MRADCKNGEEEFGLVGVALVASVLLFRVRNGGIELLHPGALVEACPRARGGSGGTNVVELEAGATAANKRCCCSSGDDDAIPRMIDFFLLLLKLRWLW